MKTEYFASMKEKLSKKSDSKSDGKMVKSIFGPSDKTKAKITNKKSK